MKILLVEPDKVLANLYKQALTGKGYEVSVAATAQEAIFAVDEQQPDLILLEIQLVGHSGMEFLYELRSYADWQHVPVAVLSNVPVAEFADCRQLLERELGVRGYHYKPLLSLKALLSSVEKIFSKVEVTLQPEPVAELVA